MSTIYRATDGPIGIARCQCGDIAGHYGDCSRIDRPSCANTSCNESGTRDVSVTLRVDDGPIAVTLCEYHARLWEEWMQHQPFTVRQNG